MTILGINKPSRALEAMVKGLDDMTNSDDFIVDMSVYHDTVDGICYGCAATCALQELSGVRLPTGYVDRDEVYGEPVKKLEEALELARSGYCEELFMFFGHQNVEMFDRRWHLCGSKDTVNWNQDTHMPDARPLILSAIEEMKAMGL